MRPTWKTASVDAQRFDLVERFCPRVFSMEVWWCMITIINVDNNSKEAADTRHSLPTLLDQFPNRFRSHRHIKMFHSVWRQRVNDRIDYGRGGADGSGLADSFNTQRIDG